VFRHIGEKMLSAMTVTLQLSQYVHAADCGDSYERPFCAESGVISVHRLNVFPAAYCKYPYQLWKKNTFQTCTVAFTIRFTY